MNRLAPLYRKMVEDGSGNFFGLTVLKHAAEIGALIERHGAKTLLDVGCGRGDAYREPHSIHKAWGIEAPRLYDPAFAEHDEFPPNGMIFDAVICCDVLEHIPEDEVERFIGDLFMRAGGFVWASVCCRKAKKEFPEGGNLHVTVRSLAWWGSKMAWISRSVSAHRLGPASPPLPFYLVEAP